MESPLVSVVIPCYLGENFLPQAVESCLAQTHPFIDLIVVNDASPDRCHEIAVSYARRDARVRVVDLPSNRGVSGAFNAGFAVARGQYFARLAQDDWFAPPAIATMVTFMAARPNTALAYWDMTAVDAEGSPKGVLRAGPPTELGDRNVVGLCVLWRREVSASVGLFNPQYDAAEDYEYWLRVANGFRIARAEGPALLFCREHAGMGTIAAETRQLHAAARARARHVPMTRPVRRRLLAEAWFHCSLVHRSRGARFPAAAAAWMSIVLSPRDRSFWRAAGVTIRQALAPHRR